MTLASEARDIIGDAIEALDENDWFDGAIFGVELGYPGTERETTDAFTSAGFMLTNVVILDPVEAAHPQAHEVPDASLAEMTIWYYAADTETGRGNIATLRGMVFDLFQDETIDVDSGVAFAIWSSEGPTRECSDEFRDAVKGSTVFRIHYTRR